MALDLTVDVNKQLQPVVDQLAEEYDGRVPRRTVERTVRQVQREFGDPRVTQFLPVLIEREGAGLAQVNC